MIGADLGFAWRVLRRRPLVTAAAALSLAVGIGLNAAVFSVIDWVLLRPLPYPAAHELVRVFTAGTSPVTGPQAVTSSEFEALAPAAAFRRSAGFSAATRILAGAGTHPVHVVLARVAGDLFGTLGVDASLGRTFSLDERSGAPVVVLRHELWQRQFASNPDIAGRIVTIDGRAHTVIGVMPPDRGYPADADLWRPLTADEREDDDRELSMLARLRTDAASASAEVAGRMQAASAGARSAWVEDVQRSEAAHVRDALRALLAAALLILVITCANVAALVGAQGADRAAEMTVRAALGASRTRLVQQLLTESLALAAIGGLLGWLAGRWALDALVAMAPVAIPRIGEIALDGRVMLAGLAATLVTGLLVGLAPAVRLTRSAALHHAPWNRTTPRSNLRRMMVMAQVSSAVVLTVAAGLLVRSLNHLVAIDHGFADRQLLAIDIDLRGMPATNAAALFRNLVAGAEAVPGVRGAAVSMRLPTQVIGLRAQIQLAGQSEGRGPAVVRPIDPDYLDTAGIPLLAGRQLTSADGRSTPRVAIVNGAFVRGVLDGRPAVGTQFTSSLGEAPMLIVGVAGDVTPAGEPDRPAFYVPLEQRPIGGGYLVVRSDGDPGAIVPALTARLRTAAPGLALDRVRRVAEALEESRAVTRFTTQLAAAFAALALLLSMIGVYGLVAGEVTARWRELALRLALGASPRTTLWTALRPCGRVLAAGTLLGVVGALAAGPALASLLHGVSVTDWATLLAAPALLMSAGIAAAGLAARRVLRADPSETLRSE